MIIYFFHRCLCKNRIDLFIKHRFHITSIDVEVVHPFNDYSIVFVCVIGRGTGVDIAVSVFLLLAEVHHFVVVGYST